MEKAILLTSVNESNSVPFDTLERGDSRDLITKSTISHIFECVKTLEDFPVEKEILKIEILRDEPSGPYVCVDYSDGSTVHYLMES